MQDQSRRAWVQFCLRTVLCIMLCVGIGLGTYRQGFQDGRNYKEPPPKPSFGYASVYYVEDLLAAGSCEDAASGLDDIRHRITAIVLPQSWKENGGKDDVRVFEANYSLVVMQDQSGHEEVASYLKSLRASSTSAVDSP